MFDQHRPNKRQSRLKYRLFIAASIAAIQTGPLHAELASETFLNPPLEARPSALWTWMNAHVDQQQLTHELEEMKDKGMRGAIIWDMGALIDPEHIIPVGPPFLGPESVASIHHVLDQAERLGLEMGLSAASSWNAGGPWISADDGCQTVAWASLQVTGPKRISLPLPLPEKAMSPTTTLAVIAVPSESGIIHSHQTIRLNDQVNADGMLTWSAPAGNWQILHFVSTATGQKLMCPSPQSKGLMVDHLSAQATRAHINHVMDAITKGGSKGLTSLKTLFLDSYEVKTPIDWTPEFATAFQQAYGYDPLPWLPVLAGKTVDNEELSARFRHDYGKLVSDLVIENHFALARSITNQHGLKLLAEAGHGGHARFDTLKALGAVDIPMGEFWNHRKNWCTKEASSAANLYGKTLVNAEAMTGWQNWQDGPQMYKRLTDIAFCAGLNQITFHTFAHNPPDAGLPGYAYHAGEHFNVNLTWWPQARPLLDTLSRSCHLLQQGRMVADVVAYYGNGAPNLVPARRLTPTVEPRWTADKCLHCGEPHPVDLSTLGQGHDYDYLNEEILVGQMQVKDGKLTLPSGMEYRLLALPNRQTISPLALTKIEQLVLAGATVVGPKPERSNSMHGYPQCDEKVQEIAARIWGNSNGTTIRSHTYGKGQVFWNTPIHEVLDQLGVQPDFTVEGIDNSGRKIDSIHRTTGSEEIYFVTNTSDDSHRFHATFRIGDSHVPSFWNPEDGSNNPCLVYQTTSNSTTIPLTLAPASSAFVVFSKSSPGTRPAHVTSIEATGTSGQPFEVISLDDDKLQLHVRHPSTINATTSSGQSGTATVTTTAADLPVSGPWQLSFPPDRGAPASVTFNSLIDWTNHPDPGVRYFSGTATYKKSLELPTEITSSIASGVKVYLNLGTVRETATVEVNGQAVGTLWKTPYRIEVTKHLKPGTNHLQIGVTNTWNNRIVGDAQHDDDTNITRTNLREKFSASSPLIPSGIIGPVTLETSTPVTIDFGND